MKQLITVTGILLLIVSCKNDNIPIENKPIENTITSKEIGEAIVREEKIKIDSIGILLYEGFFELDAIGPYSVLSNMIGTKVFFVSEKRGIIQSSSGLQINVQNDISEIEHLDIILIPGGATGTVATSKNQKILDWIQKIDQTSTFTTSVCTGAWILGEADLLKNKKATSNWYRAEEKLNKYGAEFIEKRWVRDGKLWTSAGVSAGIDMSLAIINEIKGETYTKLTMLNLEYDPKPPITGGSVHNTNKGLVNHMTGMYDSMLKSEIVI